MTFLAEGTALNLFFRGEFVWCHSMDCLFVSGWKWWIHVSLPVTMVDKKSPSASRRASNSEHMIFPCFLCSSAMLRGTHEAHTFKYPFWWMILSTLPLPVPSSLVLILRSFRIRLSARCVDAGVRAVDGRPQCGRSGRLSCPCSDDASRFARRLTLLAFIHCHVYIDVC
jgi:hypothetical protein